ncbi:MAG: LysE family translocator [Bacteroidales bacterium]|nr:LysE family translocator [Bacteroidales bacterium]MDE6515987.1 LysE family translocator [Bacteroidales bacterium]MDE7103357.1 LysE family translocator [Bacteroidales bacterium]
MMWHTCVEGFLLGLGLAVMLGPAFFSLVQTSLRNGFKAAMRLAFGIFLSDSALVCISFYGAAKLFELPTAKHIIGLVGGAILVGYGIYTYRMRVDEETFMKKSQEIQLKKAYKGPSWWVDFLRGFLTNMANPATWLFWFFWVGIIMGQNTEHGQIHKLNVVLFFGCALLTVLTTDLIKSLIAYRLKPYMTAGTMRIVNRIVGVLLFLFGLYLMLYVVLELAGIPVTGFQASPATFPVKI